jgi:pyrroline-5-carboxylate reductase
MRIGLIGAGNMAGALARGWAEPVVVFDPDEARAAELAAETGGEAVASNADLARRCDVVVLCHKPAQLDTVAAETDGAAKAVVSILGGTPVAHVERAYPGVPVYRFMPNIPAEVRRGVLCYAPGRLAADGPEAEVLELFGRLGVIIPLDESLIEPATALMGCGPAFFALMVEALVDAGVRHGLPPAEAARMTVETMAGTAELLSRSEADAGSLRRRVTSPGGSTARGLAELERGGVRAAFADAVAAVAGGSPGRRPPGR